MEQCGHLGLSSKCADPKVLSPGGFGLSWIFERYTVIRLRSLCYLGLREFQKIHNDLTLGTGATVSQETEDGLKAMRSRWDYHLYSPLCPTKWIFF